MDKIKIVGENEIIGAELTPFQAAIDDYVYDGIMHYQEESSVELATYLRRLADRIETYDAEVALMEIEELPPQEEWEELGVDLDYVEELYRKAGTLANKPPTNIVEEREGDVTF